MEMKKLVAALLAVSLGCVAAEARAQPASPTPAPKHYIFVVQTNPVPGREAEYNDWYTKVHLPDLVKVPGIVSAQRFEVAAQNTTPTPYRYLAIYDIVTTDLAATQKAMAAMAGTAAMPISPALDTAHTVSVYYEELTPKVLRPGS
jgi:hypothetical protein